MGEINFGASLYVAITFIGCHPGMKFIIYKQDLSEVEEYIIIIWFISTLINTMQMVGILK